MLGKLKPLSLCAINYSSSVSVASYLGKIIDSEVFSTDVNNEYQYLKSQSHLAFALFYEEAYPFAVTLFALLHAGKEIWIAPNNKQTTAEQLIRQACHLLGDWQGREDKLERKPNHALSLSELDLHTAELIIFTSGSTGKPKAIKKTLGQFQREIEVLEQQWGTKLGQAEVIATVSHQHIYGLLFRILWPLAAERCFHSAMYLSPEPLLKAIAGKSAYWVSSPAQQKRLDQQTPWNEIKALKAVFSSGGRLDEAIAQEIYQCSSQRVIEVYGSSETGGIAWRESVTEARWTFFEGVSVKISTEKQFELTSPFLPPASRYFLDDRIVLDADGLFTLQGRVDRIVKVEEKRLSLDEMEHELSRITEIETAHCLLWSTRRDWIVAVIVLTDEGRESLRQQGRAVLIKRIRSQLMKYFETVVIPRKWLLMDSLPLTVQGKFNQQIINDLLALDSKKFPQLQFCQQQEKTVELLLRIQPELVYFDGHFPDQPILAGVTQLAWIEQYGKIFFSINGCFLHMEVIKFKKIIQPKDVISLKLDWNSETGKLYFDLKSETESHASGRLLYGAAR